MDKRENPLWASSSGEILKHGITLLNADTDINCRLVKK